MSNQSQPKTKSFKCPCCDGKGTIEMIVKTVAVIQRSQRIKIAKRLRKKGLSIRAIAETLGFKHPGSVSDLLK